MAMYITLILQITVDALLRLHVTMIEGPKLTGEWRRVQGNLKITSFLASIITMLVLNLNVLKTFYGAGKNLNSN